MTTTRDAQGPVDCDVSRCAVEVAGEMLKRAEAAGLAAEVVAAFGNFRAAGDNDEAAAAAALYEWDI